MRRKPSLAIEMQQRDDRFATEIKLIQGDSATFLRSVEGNTNQMWPSSPALQEVVSQANSAGPFLAGVGRAGLSHWSVIIVPLDEGTGFEFDFACRIKSEAEWLGSTYETRGCDELSVVDGKVEIRVGETVLSCAAADSSKILQQRRQIAIVADDIQPQILPRTVRWKYRIGLEL